MFNLIRTPTTVKGGVLYFRKIPRAVKDKFKSTCYRRGDSMQDVIWALMLTYARHPERFKIKKRTKPKKKKPKKVKIKVHKYKAEASKATHYGNDYGKEIYDTNGVPKT